MSVARRVGPADPAQRNSSTSTRPTSSRAAVPVSGASGASERADARMQAERRLTTPSLSSPTRTTTRTRTTRRRRTTTTTRMRRSPRRRTTTERRLSAPRPSIYLALSALRPVVSVVGPINPGLRLNVRPARQPSPSVSAASQPVPRLSRQQREIFPSLASAPVLECLSDAPAPPSRPERVWPSQRPRSIQQRAALHLSDGPAHSDWLKSTPSILALAAHSVQGHRSSCSPRSVLPLQLDSRRVVVVEYFALPLPHSLDLSAMSKVSSPACPEAVSARQPPGSPGTAIRGFHSPSIGPSAPGRTHGAALTSTPSKSRYTRFRSTTPPNPVGSLLRVCSFSG